MTVAGGPDDEEGDADPSLPNHPLPVPPPPKSVDRAIADRLRDALRSRPAGRAAGG